MRVQMILASNRTAMNSGPSGGLRHAGRPRTAEKLGQACPEDAADYGLRYFRRKARPTGSDLGMILVVPSKVTRKIEWTTITNSEN